MNLSSSVFGFILLTTKGIWHFAKHLSINTKDYKYNGEISKKNIWRIAAVQTHADSSPILLIKSKNTKAENNCIEIKLRRNFMSKNWTWMNLKYTYLKTTIQIKNWYFLLNATGITSDKKKSRI